MAERKLEDRVAIVTGGGSGIGEATCERLARAGAAVVVADINADAAGEVAERIRGEGNRALAVRFDLMEAESNRALVAATIEAYGRIDILHNNAVNGSPDVWGQDKGILEMDGDVWDKTFATNVRGAMELAQFAVPHMIARGKGGVIVNTSSGAGDVGQMTMSAYGSSKGAMNSLTRYMALQFAPHKIRCNALVLGVVLTKGLERLFTEAQIQALSNNALMKEPHRPHDIAAVVEFLVSDDARLITGKLWQV